MSEFIGLENVELRIGDGGDPTEAFNAITLLTALDWSGRARSAVETTNFASTARTYISGPQDNGEITGEYNYSPAATYQEQLETDYEAGTVRNFELDYTDGTTTVTYSFAAVIVELSTASPLDDVVKRSFRLKISGEVTEAQA